MLAIPSGNLCCSIKNIYYSKTGRQLTLLFNLPKLLAMLQIALYTVRKKEKPTHFNGMHCDAFTC